MNEQEEDAYTDEAGDPAIAPSIAVFLDILGTKARAKSLTVEFLRSYIKTRETYLYMLDNERLRARQRSLMFTDNILVGFVGDDPEPMLVASFNAASFQLGLALNGHILNGGIASGPLYVGNGLAHGQALVDAYMLQATVAKQPRVVLSPGLRRMLATIKEAGLPGGISERVAGNLYVVDEDGEIFLDYLCVMSDFATIEPEFDLELPKAFETHREVAVAGLESAPEAARSKYLWMIDYHNWAVEQLDMDAGLLCPDARVDRDPDRRKAFERWSFDPS